MSGEWATEEAILKLREEWAKGTSTREIGGMLDVTKRAIIGKAKQLSLPSRGPRRSRSENRDHGTDAGEAVEHEAGQNARGVCTVAG